MRPIRPADGPLRAAVHLPGSKSYTNRALLVAALAEGWSTLRGALFSDDTRYMGEALRSLGFRIEVDAAAEAMRVEGQAGRIPAAQANLFCGNAGTAVRFLTALCALGEGPYRIDGTERMRERPQQPLLDALNQLGAQADSQRRDGCPPLSIAGRGCRGGACRMDGSVSSQYFSALAMVGAVLPEGVDITVEGELITAPYLDLTADLMATFGGVLEHEDYRRFKVAGGQSYQAMTYQVEPTPRPRYFFAAAAVTGGGSPPWSRRRSLRAIWRSSTCSRGWAARSAKTSVA